MKKTQALKNLSTEELGKLFPIEVVPYDKNWKNKFENEKILVQKVGRDGMRLDTVKHVPRTFWEEFVSSIKNEYPDFYFEEKEPPDGCNFLASIIYSFFWSSCLSCWSAPGAWANCSGDGSSPP